LSSAAVPESPLSDFSSKHGGRHGRGRGRGRGFGRGRGLGVGGCPPELAKQGRC
jgi:hypothetical protein